MSATRGARRARAGHRDRHDCANPGGGESDHHFSASNEKAAQEKGVKRVCVPNRNTRSAERKREQKKRWFREGQRWRTGCEGRISVVKRRHGLNRCRDKGERGMQRWVGFGVIANNLINIGRENQNNYGRN